MTQFNRFTLEAQIMAAWNTKEDLDLFLKSFDNLTDEQANFLIGLSEIHESRMSVLWETFESGVNGKKII